MLKNNAKPLNLLDVCSKSFRVQPPKIRMVCSTTAALPMASGRTLAINSQNPIYQLLLGIIPGNNCLGGMFFVHN